MTEGAAPVPAAERTLGGYVEDAEGRPVAGAEVAIEGSRESTRTDSDGGFLLRSTSGDGPAVLVVRDGTRTVRLPVEASFGDRVRVAAVPADAVSLRVLTPGSAPVPTRFGWLALTRGETGLSAGPSGEAPAPRFAVRGLSAGEHSVVVWAGPFLPAVVDGIVLDGSTSHPLVTVELTRRGASVAGRVVDPAGGPRSGAVVSVRPEDAVVRLPPRRASSTSDAGGRYRIEGLPPGRYLVTVESGVSPTTESTVNLLPREERALDVACG